MYKLRQSINYSALYSSRVPGILVGWVDFSTVGDLESGRSQSWNIQILHSAADRLMQGQILVSFMLLSFASFIIDSFQRS